MARPPRVNWEGAWYHVTDRGNERAAIFRDDEERSHLVEMLGRMSQRYQIRVHVYTWMDNHYLCGAPHKTCYVQLRIM